MNNDRCPICWEEAKAAMLDNPGTSLMDNYRQALVRNFSAEHIEAVSFRRTVGS